MEDTHPGLRFSWNTVLVVLITYSLYSYRFKVSTWYGEACAYVILNSWNIILKYFIRAVNLPFFLLWLAQQFFTDDTTHAKLWIYKNYNIEIYCHWFIVQGSLENIWLWPGSFSFLESESIVTCKQILSFGIDIFSLLFDLSPKERKCRRMLKLPHNCTHPTH